MSKLLQVRKHKDLVYDVGMHQGEDADYYLKKGFRVIGFEADPDLTERCRHRFSEEIRNGQLVVVEGAIVDVRSRDIQDGKIEFYRNKNNSVWGTVVEGWANRNESFGTSNEVLEISVVDFSECLKEYGIPRYLKIDIEGMDRVCLRALLDFEQKPDYVSIESEKVCFDKLEEELDLLSKLGYPRFKAVQQAGISNQKEPNPSIEGRYVGYPFLEGSSGLFGADLPNDWKNKKDVLDQYESIFRSYKKYGNTSPLSKSFAGSFFINVLSLALRKPLPGWYDTHAVHSSVISRVES